MVKVCVLEHSYAIHVDGEIFSVPGVNPQELKLQEQLGVDAEVCEGERDLRERHVERPQELPPTAALDPGDAPTAEVFATVEARMVDNFSRIIESSVARTRVAARRLV
eukprot:307010-Rhodomonas_salina.3